MDHPPELRINDCDHLQHMKQGTSAVWACQGPELPRPGSSGCCPSVWPSRPTWEWFFLCVLACPRRNAWRSPCPEYGEDSLFLPPRLCLHQREHRSSRDLPSSSQIYPSTTGPSTGSPRKPIPIALAPLLGSLHGWDTSGEHTRVTPGERHSPGPSSSASLPWRASFPSRPRPDPTGFCRDRQEACSGWPSFPLDYRAPADPLISG